MLSSCRIKCKEYDFV